MVAQVKYLSDKAMLQLKANVRLNEAKYRESGFGVYADDPAWDINLGVEFDDGLLATLDISMPKSLAAVDLKNSKIVGRALSQLTPTLANEERVWVRLAHIEAFAYSKIRWLDSTSDDLLQKAVETHLFASTQTGIRDDHALSRLWWNYKIAELCWPEDVDGALSLILKTADIRSNFVERIWMTSRRCISSVVLEAMRDDSWICEGERNFREFMKTLNKFGGGIVFESLDSVETRSFVSECADRAKREFL